MAQSKPGDAHALGQLSGRHPSSRCWRRSSYRRFPRPVEIPRRCPPDQRCADFPEAGIEAAVRLNSLAETFANQRWWCRKFARVSLSSPEVGSLPCWDDLNMARRTVYVKRHTVIIFADLPFVSVRFFHCRANRMTSVGMHPHSPYCNTSPLDGRRRVRCSGRLFSSDARLRCNFSRDALGLPATLRALATCMTLSFSVLSQSAVGL